MTHQTADLSTPVGFKNPRRPVRAWCDGYLQSQHRVKKGVVQWRVFMLSSPSYFVWVNQDDISLHTQFGNNFRI